MIYKAVFFDFDYTLGDATDAILAGFTQGLTQMGFPTPDREAVRHTVGLPLELAYEALTGDTSPAHQSQFCTLFAAVARPIQAKGVPLFPGAANLLHALHGKGIHVAVASTKHHAALEMILAQHHLLPALDFIIGGDDVANMKPAPDCLNLGLTRLGLAPGDLLFCGDTVIDAQTAQRAGCPFAAVLNGTTAADAFAQYPHVHIAPDLPNLQRFLGVSSTVTLP